MHRPGRVADQGATGDVVLFAVNGDNVALIRCDT
jgi:hypothetical protein